MFSLYQALKIIVKKDSWQFRQSVFKELRKQNLTIRTISSIYKIMPAPFKALMLYSYGFFSFLRFPSTKCLKPILALYEYQNEKRQLDFLERIAGNSLIEIRKCSGVYFCTNFFNTIPFILLTKISFFLMLAKKYDFLVGCRTSSALFYFVASKRILKRNKIQATIVSSDTNPYAMGLTWAAKSMRLKTLYINHGHIPEGPPRLFFDYAFLDGNALLDVYKRTSPTSTKVIFKGCEGDYRPLNLSALKNDSIRIGVFQSLITDTDLFLNIINQLRSKSFVKSILVRLHPNLVIRNKKIVKKISQMKDVQLSYANELATCDLKNCDLVIAGNSSVHLTSLKFGVPSIYLNQIDIVPHDFYLLLKNNIIPYFDSVDEIDLDKVIDFFNENWPKAFQYFDASYGLDYGLFSRKIKHTFEEVLR